MSEAEAAGLPTGERYRGDYRGRFAPSPTGPLHQGSLISALASYLDARVHEGEWLVRIEDVDGPRAVPGMAEDIVATLSAYGMQSDRPPVWQSSRLTAYEAAFSQLVENGYIYPCGCSRREIADSLTRAQAEPQRNATLVYPGTCRDGLQGKTARAWRLRVTPLTHETPRATSRIEFTDRWMGRQSQDLAREVGDFALKRADGLWAYQLAVVVDDAAAGITDIVRGADLLDTTPRQIYLQHCLGLPTPRYLHVPVLTNASGEKYSKQNGAPALPRAPGAMLAALIDAAAFLGLPIRATTIGDFHEKAKAAWKERLDTLSET